MTDIAKLNADLQELRQQLDQTGVFTQNATKSMGIYEKQMLKIKTAIKKSPLIGLAATMKSYAKSVFNVTQATGGQATMTKEQAQKHRNSMTVLQKFTAATISYGVAQKISNKILSKSNNILTRFVVRLFSLLSVFLVIGFALAAFALALQGANSPLLTLTEDIPGLHDALQGLVLVIHGEGDEGGAAAAFDVLAAAMLGASIAAIALGGPFGVLVGSIILVVGNVRILHNEFDNLFLTIGVGAGIVLLLASAFIALKAATLATLLGIQVATVTAFAGIMAGIGLLIGGIGGLVAFAMGAGEGIQAVLLFVLSAVAVFVAGILLFPTVIIAAKVALVAAIIALVIRFRTQIFNLIVGILTFIRDLLGLIFFGIIGALGSLIGAILGMITAVIGLIVGLITGVFNALFQIGVSFAEKVIYGGTSLKDWFLGLPGVIGKGFVNGFKRAFNGIIGLFNKLTGKLSFKIPKWVPKIGGDTFRLPKIPLMAKGGYVTSPTLAMVGEDGPEAVIPLNRKNNPAGIGLGGGGGEVTVNINVSGVTDRSDKRALAKEIGDLIRMEMSRNGRSYGNRRSGV